MIKMTYLDVDDPVREMSTKRIGDKLSPQLKYIKTDHLSDYLNSSLQGKSVIVGSSDKSVTEFHVKKFNEYGGKYMFAKNLDCEE